MVSRVLRRRRVGCRSRDCVWVLRRLCLVRWGGERGLFRGVSWCLSRKSSRVQGKQLEHIPISPPGPLIILAMTSSNTVAIAPPCATPGHPLSPPPIHTTATISLVSAFQNALCTPNPLVPLRAPNIPFFSFFSALPSLSGPAPNSKSTSAHPLYADIFLPPPPPPAPPLALRRPGPDRIAVSLCRLYD